MTQEGNGAGDGDLVVESGSGGVVEVVKTNADGCEQAPGGGAGEIQVSSSSSERTGASCSMRLYIALGPRVHCGMQMNVLIPIPNVS